MRSIIGNRRREVEGGFGLALMDTGGSIGRVNYLLGLAINQGVRGGGEGGGA
jgi:hypothetical protein